MQGTRLTHNLSLSHDTVCALASLVQFLSFDCNNTTQLYTRVALFTIRNNRKHYQFKLWLLFRPGVCASVRELSGSDPAKSDGGLPHLSSYCALASEYTLQLRPACQPLFGKPGNPPTFSSLATFPFKRPHNQNPRLLFATRSFLVRTLLSIQHFSRYSLIGPMRSSNLRTLTEA